ncbi:hypothetical protein PVAP13_6KG333700 [Panicum virgatum]|uniref:Uncharacterized protein n=1 Tax=Panicum virgatum TaxID=38727 RepID=A0A8T0RIN4_PANVG|nr:hypothetical protein PVAP13_6KG333700 [Panicum virgatum]
MARAVFLIVLILAAVAVAPLAAEARDVVADAAGAEGRSLASDAPSDAPAPGPDASSSPSDAPSSDA